MNKPLSPSDRETIRKAPRIWVSFPDGRKMKVIKPGYRPQDVAERKKKELEAALRAKPASMGYYPRTTAKAIIASISYATGISAADILSGIRTRETVRARNAAMYLCSVKLGMSYPAIAKRFDRDHTTTLHGVKRHIAARRALGRRMPDAKPI